MGSLSSPQMVGKFDIRVVEHGKISRGLSAISPAFASSASWAASSVCSLKRTFPCRHGGTFPALAPLQINLHRFLRQGPGSPASYTPPPGKAPPSASAPGRTAPDKSCCRYPHDAADWHTHTPFQKAYLPRRAAGTPPGKPLRPSPSRPWKLPSFSIFFRQQGCVGLPGLIGRVHILQSPLCLFLSFPPALEAYLPFVVPPFFQYVCIISQFPALHKAAVFPVAKIVTIHSDAIQRRELLVMSKKELRSSRKH